MATEGGGRAVRERLGEIREPPHTAIGSEAEQLTGRVSATVPAATSTWPPSAATAGYLPGTGSVPATRAADPGRRPTIEPSARGPVWPPTTYAVPPMLAAPMSEAGADSVAARAASCPVPSLRIWALDPVDPPPKK